MTLKDLLRRYGKAAALLLFVTFLVYSPCLRGQFLWDDDAYVSQNATLTDLHGLRDIWLRPGSVPQYYPVTFTALWIQYHLWGLHPAGYHTVNILLHGINAVLLWIILEGWGIPGAWIAAWLFALHPIEAESVAWMTELKNVLSTFFALLALLFFQKRGEEKRTARFYDGVAILLFICALLSKSVTVTLPVSYLLIRRWMQGSWDKRITKSLAPFIGIGAAAALFTLYYEHHLVRAEGLHWAFSWGERFIIAGHAFWFYLAKLIHPSPLVFIYPRWSLASLSFLDHWYGPFALVFLAGLAYGKKWWGKLPFACLLFFALSLSPAIGLSSFYFMRFSFVADHFQYVASMGVFALAGWLVSRGLETLQIKAASPAGLLVVGMICVNLALATFQQSQKYKDSLHLWEHTLTYNPDSAIAHHNMGIALSDAHRWNEAIAHLRTAEALDPSFPQTHLALAYFAVQTKRWEVARHQYEEAMRLGVRDPQVLKDYAALPAKRS